ncbi:MAG TPA: response regulator [Planctomycetes bacterium]|nr:response regulator [Planctomycetota bacterium]
MRRKEVTKELVEKAIRAYLEIAYGTKESKGIGIQVSEQNPFGVFVDETPAPREAGEKVLHRYSLRLGNRDYPFMKLLLQEHMARGAYYFGVDTHDHLEIRPDFPDFEDWMRVKRSNFQLKEEIEEAFHRQGIPTLGSIKDEIPIPQHEGEVPEHRGRILVVDDEQEEADLLKRLLEGEGYDVDLARNGREALEILRRKRPSLVLLDYEMPEMDGMQVIEELRGDPSTRNLPILLSTSSQILASERDQADGFLPKPFVIEDLLALVEKMLAQG